MTQRLAFLLLAAQPLAAFAHTGHGEHGILDVFSHLSPTTLLVVLPAVLFVGAWIRRSAGAPK